MESRQEKIENIKRDIRKQLFQNGKNLATVARIFRQADFNGNKKLDFEEVEINIFNSCFPFIFCFIIAPNIVLLNCLLRISIA